MLVRFCVYCMYLLQFELPFWLWFDKSVCCAHLTEKSCVWWPVDHSAVYFFTETYSTTELCLGTTYVYYNTLKMVNARLYGRSTSLGGKFWKYSYIYLYVFTFVKSSCRQQSLSWLRFLDLRPTHELVVSQRKVVPLPLSATLPRWANPIALYV